MRTLWIVLVVVGVLLFIWAGQQAANVGDFPRYLVPPSVADSAAAQRATYQVLQLVGAAVAVVSGGLWIRARR